MQQKKISKKITKDQTDLRQNKQRQKILNYQLYQTILKNIYKLKEKPADEWDKHEEKWYNAI